MDIPPLTIEYFERLAYPYKDRIDAASVVIDMLAAFVPHCMAAGTDQEIVEPYLQAQLASGAQGACFLHRDDLGLEDLKGFVGNSVFDALSNASHSVRIALVDALYSEINKLQGVVPSSTLEFGGTYAEKSLFRARKIVELTGVQAGHKVAIVGVVNDIVRAVLETGAKDVGLSDFRQAGSTLLGLPIQNNTMPLIQWADMAIVTGNILKTRTAEEILDVANRASTKITIFSMTGSNIAPRFREYGADLVTVEKFPYYWFAGTRSQMQVFD